MSQSNVISNPIAPNDSVYQGQNKSNPQPLSNSDFRKLLMTPKPSQKSSTGNKETESSRPFGNRGETRGRPFDPSANPSKSKQKSSHKRTHIAKIKKPLAKEEVGVDSTPYRDRAKERREGKSASHVEGLNVGNEDNETETDDRMLSRTADYRAVAPTITAGATHAERRLAAIEESKYLGGDMEHTHLVKGLDYVLLHKVRMEIDNKEHEAEELLDEELQKPVEKKEEGPQFRTRLAANIFETIFKSNQSERNEYFQVGRMAYRVDLEDELAESDIPATVIRSKADCPYIDLLDSTAMTTNDIVIAKLTQIFSYLRAGRRQAKKAKAKQKVASTDYGIENFEQKSSESRIKNPIASIPIYENIPKEYTPLTSSRSAGKSHSSKHPSHHHSNQNERSGDANHGGKVTSSRLTDNKSNQSKSRYFERPESNLTSAPEAPLINSVSATKEIIRELDAKYGGKLDAQNTKEKVSLDRLLKKSEISGYDECYPGFAESYDAMGDSDDETDFSKMDIGSKKGPIGRWDFETQEEYGEYMSNKEAMPKAAFQYGLKMNDGRRTRRLGGPQGQRNEKAEFDRQWQQIQSLMNKRKSTSDDLNSEGKKIKH